MTTARKIFLLSPFGGEERKLRYARRALRHSITQGEAPFASHLLYPQVLDEGKLHERLLGILLGKQWLDAAEGMVVYGDYGISEGMVEEMWRWLNLDRGDEKMPAIEIRLIGRNQEDGQELALETVGEGSVEPGEPETPIAAV